MNKQTFQGKNKEEAVIKAMEALNAKEDELIIVEKDIKKTLFKKTVEIDAITKTDLNQEIKDYILKVVKDMGINAKIETKTKEDTPVFNLIAPETPILIGRNGRTVEALGLTKMHKTVELPNNAATKGMIAQVSYLVKVEE